MPQVEIVRIFGLLLIYNAFRFALQAQFLDELLHLLGDDDARVREHAACCLCRFIMQTARQQQQQLLVATTTTTKIEEGSSSSSISGNISNISSTETQQTNFNLLWDFFDYRIFGSMSVTLRNLFRPSSTITPPMSVDAGEHSHCSTEAIGFGAGGGVGAAASVSAYFDGSYNVGNGNSIGNGFSDGHVFAFGSQRQIAQEEKVLAKVLYRMTNKLMTLNDKNMQVNIYIELYRNAMKCN